MQPQPQLMPEALSMPIRPEVAAAAEAPRDRRVRFKYAVRIVPLGGLPRAYRVLSANLSKNGMFLRMPTPLDMGTKVAISLEARGRVLPFAQGEVVWRRLGESKLPGRGPGFGVRFTNFLHPRAHELVDYLVETIDTGKPLIVAPPPPKWLQRTLIAGAALAGLLVTVMVGWFLLRETPEEIAAQTDAVLAPKSGTLVAPAAPKVPEVAAVAAPVPAPVDVVAAPAVPVPEPVAPEPEPVKTPEPVAAVAQPEPVAPPAPVVEDIPAQEALVAAAPVKAPEPAKASTERGGRVKLPNGAARQLDWSVSKSELRLTLDGAVISKAFTLSKPTRVVIDLDGATPKKSVTLDVGDAAVKDVRLGKLKHGTRVVVDLNGSAKISRVDAATLLVTLGR